MERLTVESQLTQFERYRALYEASIDAIVVVDADGRITGFNPAAERTFGYSKADAVGCSMADLLIPPQHRRGHREGFARFVATGHSRILGRRVQVAAMRADGNEFPAELIIAQIDTDPARYCAYVRDVTEEPTAHQRRELLGAIVESTDDAIYACTAGRTITAWNPAAERLYGYSAAEATGRDLSELIIPPEHRAESAEMFQSVARGERIEHQETQRIRKDGSVVHVALTVSPLKAVSGANGAAVIARDITERKNREESLSRELEGLSWAGRVRDALAEDRFVLWAQPIIDLRTGETVKHELLIRMLDRDGEVIPPGAFLPAAEEHGLIGQIDRWVVSEAVELAAAGMSVEVNLSAQSVSDPNFLSDVERAIRDSGADPTKIVFEITETALMEQLDGGIEFARRLSALGCGFALDDFGTGFGSFTYLKRLPVDTLKIDIEFVRDLASDTGSQHVVQTVVNLAQGFDLETVAEGVEDEETLALLREFGVDYAQGYHFGRPAPLSAKSAAAPEEKAR